jgi:hypothetical protein
MARMLTDFARGRQLACIAARGLYFADNRGCNPARDR